MPEVRERKEIGFCAREQRMKAVRKGLAGKDNKRAGESEPGHDRGSALGPDSEVSSRLPLNNRY